MDFKFLAFVLLFVSKISLEQLQLQHGFLFSCFRVAFRPQIHLRGVRNYNTDFYFLASMLLFKYKWQIIKRFDKSTQTTSLIDLQSKSISARHSQNAAANKKRERVSFVQARFDSLFFCLRRFAQSFASIC